MDNTNIQSTSAASKVMKQKDIKQVTKKQLILKIVSLILVYTFLVAVAVTVLFPFYFMLISSVKSPEEFKVIKPALLPWQFNNGDNWAKQIEWENYKEVFTKDNLQLGRLMLNTVFVGVVSTVLSIVITVLSAFAFARLEFKGKNALFAFLLATMMIPGELFTITNYGTVAAFGSEDFMNGMLSWMGKDTYGVLIVPFLVSVFYIYLLKQNFQQVPNELYLAAKVDGTTDMKFLIKVVLPICKPTVITVIILKVIECWNSYVWPRLVTDDPEYFLVSNGIQAIRESGFGRQNIPGMMAAVVVVSVPLILLFVIFRNKIMAGVSRGGLKG